jgi:hypothetical protein
MLFIRFIRLRYFYTFSILSPCRSELLQAIFAIKISVNIMYSILEIMVKASFRYTQLQTRVINLSS